jgi:hypothetical protein
MQANTQLASLGAEFNARTARGDYLGALTVNAQAGALAPNNAKILGDEAFCHLRLANYKLAREKYLKACAIAPGDTNLWDGLTEACGHLGLMDEVRQHGCTALQSKITPGQAAFTLPGGSPPPLSIDRWRNVIAFSLFGDKPRYCETALLNVVTAAYLMPDWVCRFYVDESVPLHVRTRLEQAGAQVIMVSPEDQKDLSGLMWRFLVLEDPQVERFLLRDADSLISTREAAAVKEWLGSGKWFHLMRDYFTHTELILAGMWGGCRGVFKGLREGMANYILQGKYLGDRVVDQHYLRAHIWPTVSQSLLSHDSVFGFMQGRDFPSHAPHGLGGNFHVGCNLSGASIGAPSALPDGQKVAWSLFTEQKQVVCSYSSVVLSGQWRAELPQPYIDQIKAGNWSVALA